MQIKYKSQEHNGDICKLTEQRKQKGQHMMGDFSNSKPHDKQLELGREMGSIKLFYHEGNIGK